VRLAGADADLHLDCAGFDADERNRGNLSVHARTRAQKAWHQCPQFDMHAGKRQEQK
jgi:hypothetical protein